MHGCDAHKNDEVPLPARSRYCWIKGDLIFESLRQTILEPEQRVWIGAQPPAEDNIAACISEVHPVGAPWIAAERIPLNHGLVTIIGARGSGKTALVDILAAGCDVFDSAADESSFLKRASSLLGKSKAEIVWGDGSKREGALKKSGEEEDGERERGQVRYLSQHFVEKLCASSGLAADLRREVEQVVLVNGSHRALGG